MYRTQRASVSKASATFEAQFMKKLSNTEGEVKKNNALLIKKRLFSWTY